MKKSPRGLTAPFFVPNVVRYKPICIIPIQAMKITPREQVAIAHCLQQVANAIANPRHSAVVSYHKGMERAGHQPLSVNELRDLADQILPGPSLLSEEDHAAMQALVSGAGEICKSMVLNPRKV